MSSEGIGTLKLPDGCPCVSSVAQSFAYYDPPMIESVQSSFSEIQVIPRGGLTGPYEFNLEAKSKAFTCLNTMSMYVRAKIVQANGTNLAPADKVLLANNALHTLFSNVETKLNGTTINPQSSHDIPHKSMMESLLSYENTNNGAFQAWRFEEENDVGKMDDYTGKSYKARIKLCAASKEFDMCGPVCSDFLRSDNHLAPGNSLYLKFTRAPDALVINSTTGNNYELKITSIYLQVRLLTLFDKAIPSVIKGNAIQKYISNYTEMRLIALAAGQTSIDKLLFSGGRLPKQVIVGMALTDAVNGSYALNPFNFQHFDIKSINLKMNGMPIPQEALTPDFTKRLTMRELNHLFMNTGKYRVNAGNSIRDDQFRDGCTLFPFDLTPDMCNGFHLHAGNQGTLHLQLGWSSPTTQAITVLVYSAFDQVVFAGNDKVEVSIF